MNSFNLTKEQCEKADELLRLICFHKMLNGDKVYGLFESTVITERVIKLLENNDLVIVIESETKPYIVLVRPTDSTQAFLELDGGLTAVYKQEQAKRTREQKADELTDSSIRKNRFDLGTNKIIAIGIFVISVLTFLFQYVIPESSEPDSNKAKTGAYETNKQQDEPEISKPDTLNLAEPDTIPPATN